MNELRRDRGMGQRAESSAAPACDDDHLGSVPIRCVHELMGRLTDTDLEAPRDPEGLKDGDALCVRDRLLEVQVFLHQRDDADRVETCGDLGLANEDDDNLSSRMLRQCSSFHNGQAARL